MDTTLSLPHIPCIKNELDFPMSQIKNIPVLYMPRKSYEQIRDVKSSPFKLLVKEIGYGVGATNIFGASTNTEEMRCIVVNTIHDSSVETTSVFHGHSWQSGQPVVMDANGQPKRQASATRSLDGRIGYDWIDAPPTGYASVGVWRTNRPAFSFYGTEIGLRLAIPGRNAVLQLSQMDYLTGSNLKWLGRLSGASDKTVSDSDFQDYCNQHSSYTNSSLQPDALVLKYPENNPKLIVRMRWAGGSNGGDLYAFIEDAA